MKVYVCAKVYGDHYAYTSHVLGKLTYSGIEYLRPQMGDPSKRAHTAAFDMALIGQANELWVIGEFGMDCMWEIGYACGKGVPVTIFVDDKNEKIVENQWMLYGYPIKLVKLCDILK